MLNPTCSFLSIATLLVEEQRKHLFAYLDTYINVALQAEIPREGQSRRWQKVIMIIASNEDTDVRIMRIKGHY